jgi:hypothetical protein
MGRCSCSRADRGWALERGLTQTKPKRFSDYPQSGFSRAPTPPRQFEPWCTQSVSLFLQKCLGQAARRPSRNDGAMEIAKVLVTTVLCCLAIAGLVFIAHPILEAVTVWALRLPLFGIIIWMVILFPLGAMGPPMLWYGMIASPSAPLWQKPMKAATLGTP